VNTIICGSRKLKDEPKVFKILDGLVKSKSLTITSILSTGSSGVDRIAEMWAARKGVSCRAYRPACETHHGHAREYRDAQMIAHAGRLIIIWDGLSPELKDILKAAKKAKLEIHEVLVDENG
jgi:uncharacterized protein YukE